ncbi:hypothetical protein PsJ27TS7_22870 [Paenibacillus dendritiformis]
MGDIAEKRTAGWEKHRKRGGFPGSGAELGFGKSVCYNEKKAMLNQ